MLSSKLKTIYLISVISLVVHGIEEYFTGLYDFDSFYKSFANPRLAFVLVVLIAANVCSIGSYLLVSRGKWEVSLSILFGFVIIYELQHIVAAFNYQSYTPGLITSLAFPVLGFLFWKELINYWRLKNSLKL